jgi:riboflavin synthase
MTVVNSKETSFEVAVIPYTYNITNFHQIKAGTLVNLEFDVIGKYVAKIVRQQLGKE